jgi:hypothetical protein
MLAARERARNDPRDPGNYNVVFRDNRPHCIGGSPGFLVELVNVDTLHTAFPNQSRTRGRVQRGVRETRDHRPSPYPSVRQILLALDSNSCHNIIKPEQKFPVRNAQKANWCNCFTALKAFQVTQDFAVCQTAARGVPTERWRC